MSRLEEIVAGATVEGIIPREPVSVIAVKWHGSEVVQVTYRTADGVDKSELLYRSDEPRLNISEKSRPWSFDAPGDVFRLVSEAARIQLAALFDPLLAVHTSLVEPLPHQIMAVYDRMLPRQPLRFLLADDPGAGKTIMAGLFIKELMARGDLERCLIVAPGSLVEQWQDELDQKFQLPFEIGTNEKFEAARTGNWFTENRLAIGRLDKLSRDEDVQSQLENSEWDLIVVDEAHKMSVSFFGTEMKPTKRYQLGRMLSGTTRHFLLMTATPHNGKEPDFQGFMALLDGDRFEGRLRDGAHTTDCSDLMRRMVKEQLLRFDGKRLFPERRAYAVGYDLSSGETQLYRDVTEYVCNEFNRADQLHNDGRKRTVGFALTILQRRLASSPEAIYQSLRRRLERLESRRREAKLLARGSKSAFLQELQDRERELLELEDPDDVTAEEAEGIEDSVADEATTARTIEELEVEIEILRKLEDSAQRIRQSGIDCKWDELSKLLQDKPEMFDSAGNRRKLIIFTEHRDTLRYLVGRVSTLLGRPEAIVTIQGGMGREQRRKAEEAFRHDPTTEILIATDAAGEGINLQRAHLMVNYDLPWNPNRLEQRFGRIHRIGQTEVCHCWNLVAHETREGDVYRRLLEKIEAQREALGGRDSVFDVLGRLLEGRSLRELLVEAIRYGERSDVRARLLREIDNATEREHVRRLLDEDALARDSMDARRVQQLREDMERAEARRLQPHFIQAFFTEAFSRLGGRMAEREERRHEITRVPPAVRSRDRQIGRAAPVLQRYERVTFEKDRIRVQGQPVAAFICPGHPLLDSVIDLTLEQYYVLLEQLYPGRECDCYNADLNGDGSINWKDIDPFVAMQNHVGAQREYVWNAENRLVEVRPTPGSEIAGSQRVEFAYDYQGRRVAKRVYDWDPGDPNDPNDDDWASTPSVSRAFVWSGWLMLLELDVDPNDPNNPSTRRAYTWGLDLAGQRGSVNSLEEHAEFVEVDGIVAGGGMRRVDGGGDGDCRHGEAPGESAWKSESAWKTRTMRAADMRSAK